jgi:hypothetical protein
VQKPAGLGEPFALWTLERLQRAFEARHGVHLSDSTIWTWLRDEGLVWKRQQSWFHEPARHDPAFAEKRGPSSRRTSPRQRTRVICLDELGPLAVKTYPGEDYVRAGGAPRSSRLRRRGVLWVHGAFEPATGEAALVFSEHRDSASHIRLLEHVLRRSRASAGC